MHTIPQRGRPGAILFMTVVRSLTPQDFVDLQLKGPKKIAPAIIQRFRTKHHRAAILMAEGRSNVEVARLTGYTPQRISDFRTDPAMCDLIEGYKVQIVDGVLNEVQNMQHRLVNVGELAVDELEDRLEDDTRRRQMPLSELRQIAQLALDRSVAPPKAAPPGTTPPVNVTFNIGTRDLRPKEDLPELAPIIVENEDD